MRTDKGYRTASFHFHVCIRVLFLHPVLIFALQSSIDFLLSSHALAYTPGKKYSLTIVHVGDTHGNFLANERGEGGFAIQKSIIDNIRKDIAQKDGHLLILSSGDFNSGNPRSDFLLAKPDIEAMNLIGYDAITVGNHEFDNQVSVLEEQSKLANCPMLSSNVYQRSNGERLPFIKGHIIKNLDDLKIVIVGLTTEDTPDTISHREYVKDLNFRSVLEEVQEIIPQLKKNSDLILALTHLGLYPTKKDRGGFKGTDDIMLANAFSEIKVILGGHTHGRTEQPLKVNDAIISHSGSNNTQLARMDLSFLDGKLTLDSYRLIPVVVDQNVKADQEMTQKMQEFYRKSDHLFSQEAGEVVNGTFWGRGAPSDNLGVKGETNFGRLLAKTIKESTKSDIAMVTTGGLRVHLPSEKITYEKVITALPFHCGITTVKMNGAQLKEYLQQVINKLALGLSGISITLNNREEIKGIKVNGEEVIVDPDNSSTESEKLYQLAISKYLADGGANAPVVTTDPTYRETGLNDTEIFLNYLKTHPLLDCNDFREQSISIEESALPHE